MLMLLDNSMKAFKAYLHFVSLNSKVNGQLPTSKIDIRRIKSQTKQILNFSRGKELVPIHYQRSSGFQKKHEGVSLETLSLQNTMLADAMNSCGK